LPRARQGRWPVRRPSFGRPSQAKPPSARPGSLSTAGPKSSQPRPWAELQGDPAVVVGGKKEGEKTGPETTMLRMLRSCHRGANRTLLIGTLGGPAKRVFAASGSGLPRRHPFGPTRRHPGACGPRAALEATRSCSVPLARSPTAHLVYSPQRGSMREKYLHGGERQEYIHR
jgi:hypothetical protein